MRTVVAKFGGTSLADAAQILKVVDIIQEDPARRIIVASAPGKRFADDVKITDLLLQITYIPYACKYHRLENRYFITSQIITSEHTEKINENCVVRGCVYLVDKKHNRLFSLDTNVTENVKQISKH